MICRSGIYCITHIHSGKRYVGSSVDLRKRIEGHKAYLRKGLHRNKKLQNAWNKYGETSFSFSILDYVEGVEEILVWEQQWIDSLRPEYNINPTAGNSIGVVRSEENRKKISATCKTRGVRPPSSLGRKDSEETKEKKRAVLSRKHEADRARTHCKRGHEFTEENTYTYIDVKQGKTSRVCRICRNARVNALRASRKANEWQ